ncbi:MAG: antitoxin VapB family protein [Candidatus Micrarchaeota archaeon]
MVKVISLSEEAYKTLSDLKNKSDSFSDVVLKIGKKSEKEPITDFAGKWVGSKEETDKIFKEIEKGREKFKLRSFEI